ncbi:MAG: hypothetical protein R2713_10320 [Ilumatobacteraceae bacterium]
MPTSTPVGDPEGHARGGALRSAHGAVASLDEFRGARPARPGCASATRPRRRCPAAATPAHPARLGRHLLRPLHDETGRLVDWLLFASGFDDHDAVPQYWRWRNTWRRHWRPSEPLSNVESLRDVVADIEHDLRT